MKLDEQRATLRQLPRGGDAYRFVFDDASLGVLLLADTIEDCNATACALLGRSRAALLGADPLSLAPPSQRDGIASASLARRRVAGALAGQPRWGEWRFRRDDGSILDAAVRLEAVVVDGDRRLLLQVRERSEPERSEEALHRAALAVSTTEGDAVFRDLVRYLATSLGADVAFIALPSSADACKLRMLAYYQDGRMVEDFEYALSGTPCETVLGQQYRLYPSGLGELFPVDEDFKSLGLDCYAGYPLSDARGHALGLIAVVSRRPFPRPDRVESMLRIFAARAVSEIEHRRADQALRSAEASYRAIFDSAEDAIFVHDWDSGAIVDVNRKACQMYGYSYDELRRIRVADVSSGEPPYTEADAIRWIEQAKRAGSAEFEWHRRNRDGSLHWDEVRLKSAVIDGKPRVLAFTREITARKRAEEALRASETRHRLLFEMASDALLLVDVETLRIVDANSAAFAMYGYTREELLGLTAIDLSAEPELTATIIRSQSGAAQVPTRVHRRKGGVEFPVEISNNRFDLDGRPTILAVIRDVTQRLEREQALRRSEARLRATVEAAFDCVIGMDIEGRVIEFNPEAERVFGYSREQVLGQPLAPLIIPPRFRDAHVHGLARFRTDGAGSMVGRRVEVYAMRADGSEFPAELAIEVTDAPEGRIFVATLRDVTERRRSEEERNQLEAQLRQAQKMEAIGHLTGGIAHDFNNILTGIMGYVALAADRPAVQTDARLERYLDQALSAVRRARDLIQQMLTFSRGQRGEPRPLALGALVGETVKLLRSTLPATVEIETELAPDSPQVLLDPVHLEQVLLNLCINARDAMDANGLIRVSVRAHPHIDGVCASCRQRVRGPVVELAVMDNGPGITPEVMDRMFEPFFTTKEVGHGSGMGLASVHGIVHEYGGHIVVDTTQGRGTRFRVWFAPLDPAAMPRLAAEEQRPAIAAQRPRLSGHVLVIDDEETVGELMAEMLETWGLTVTVKRHPIAAEAWFNEDPARADLVLTDQTMPKVTGLELAQRLTLVRPELPVVLYSGYGADISKEQATRSGVCALLAKPVEPETLFDVLQAHLPGK